MLRNHHHTLRPLVAGGGGMASPLFRLRVFCAGAAAAVGAAAGAAPAAPFAAAAAGAAPAEPLAEAAACPAGPAAGAAGCPETTPKEPAPVPRLASASSDMPRLSRLHNSNLNSFEAAY